ncbi:hypothetical protein [Dokdonia sp. Asnod3-C12]|uniref:hypothetical protein n=1 Tax=Dokdonia sp. Asnod3-C12 TaxID=3160575 RepID=UPI00386C6002
MDSVRISYFYDKSVEQIIDYLVKKKMTVDELKIRLKFSNAHTIDDEKLIQKLSFAEKRMNEPLELSLKLFYLFFPFGIVNFLSNEDDNYKRFSQLGYIKKIRSYNIISLFGVLLYIIGGLLLYMYFSK